MATKRVPPSDEVGRKFGRLLVTAVRMESGKSVADCVCDCGVVKIGILLNSLRCGQLSCGCLQKINHPRTHGGSYSSEYSSWKHMKGRCHNPQNMNYQHYGARGIQVCPEWRQSFAAFLDDMGMKPTPKHTIERIDNNLGYFPANCRWATQQEQTLNTRRTRRATLNGETLTVMEWSKKIGIHDNTLYERLDRGMDEEKALTTAPGISHRHITHNGETRILSEWARITGLDAKTIHYRLSVGKTVAQALSTKRGPGGRRKS